MVEGFINGLHRSPYLGFSMDFAEHRQYMPGDDIRRIDWKVFARSDRFYVKEFEAESNTNFMAVLDVSQSMNFGSTGVTKFDYARFLAACLTYFAHKQRDRVALSPSTTTSSTSCRLGEAPRRGAAHAGSRHRHAAQPAGPSLRKLAEHFSRRGIIVIISDFYDEPDAIFEAVAPLRFRGHDVVLFHVLNPAEVDFPFADPPASRISRAAIQSRWYRRAGRADLARSSARIEALATRASAQQLDYMLNTSMPLDFALFRFLSVSASRRSGSRWSAWQPQAAAAQDGGTLRSARGTGGGVRLL